MLENKDKVDFGLKLRRSRDRIPPGSKWVFKAYHEADDRHEVDVGPGAGTCKHKRNIILNKKIINKKINKN
jgi:hypothetical protein